MAVVFDALDFMERLKAGGVAKSKDRAIADAFSHATSQQLATKADLQAMKNRLLVKLGGMAAAGVTVVGVMVVIF